MDINLIKNEKLKKLIEESFQFSVLDERKQNEMIYKMSKMSEEELERTFIPFFEKKNAEEESVVQKREAAFKILTEKVLKLDKDLKKEIQSEKETIAKDKESEAENILLNALNNI